MVAVGAIISISFRFLANQNKTYTPIPPNSEPYWIKDMARRTLSKPAPCGACDDRADHENHVKGQQNRSQNHEPWLLRQLNRTW